MKLHEPEAWAAPRDPGPDGPYAERIAAISAALGIPPDYGSRRSMVLHPEAGELVPVRTLPDGRQLFLAPPSACAWAGMVAAAALEGVTLILVSGFRSADHQRQIIERRMSHGIRLDEILRVNAAPGYSEHHTGRAVDIGTPGCPALTEAFEHTAAFRWLDREAARFGFRLTYPRDNPQGILYEPWHWCHHGLAAG